ncbi:hypothetical protein H0B56_21350 [Haloechinothrix sp. YIM 98757]|uniref:Uncharacterized protein n=1 Tax=Haloechinothrix aidingensis TaxID=2752311 RepID=A0A838AFZ4_9PSEU|nr:hypothetical protein [Haloechinothrix aidingensis]MBA0128100.1 hypothetical protein [Haloechinothrix aidingensis]
MARKQTHYHAHIDDARMSQAEPQRANFHSALDGSAEVINWLATQLREAAGNPDMELSDESELWKQLVGSKEQIATGLRGGPTIIAVPIPEDRCPCERPELRTVRGKSE